MPRTSNKYKNMTINQINCSTQQGLFIINGRELYRVVGGEYTWGITFSDQNWGVLNFIIFEEDSRGYSIFSPFSNVK